MDATRVCLGFVPGKPPKANDYQQASVQRDRRLSHMCVRGDVCSQGNIESSFIAYPNALNSVIQPTDI